MGHDPAALVYNVAELILPIYLGFWLVWVVRLVGSYRRGSGEHRQQSKWFLAGATISGVGLLISFATPTNASVTAQVMGLVSGLLLGALPLALGVGILKYRLYDVDRLISRTVSYAIVTGLLVGVYVGLVTLATWALPFSSPLGVAASTLVAVALFNPLRRRVKGWSIAGSTGLVTTPRRLSMPLRTACGRTSIWKWSAPSSSTPFSPRWSLLTSRCGCGLLGSRAEQEAGKGDPPQAA
jgi:hypothetical protein